MPAPSISAPTTSWADARRTAFDAGVPLSAQSVAPRDAVTRTLAADLVAPCDMPRFATAAMDGFAIAGDGPWLIVDPVGAHAGHPWGGTLQPGHAIPISTGAPTPNGAHSVLPVEDATITGRHLTARGGSASLGRHVRHPGEDAWTGDLLAGAGTRVGPALAGLAAALGLSALPVRRRPRVAVFVTGDELFTRGPSAVHDALTPLLPPLLSALGADAMITGVRDAVDLTRLLDRGDADVVVVTGSTSVGRNDRLRPALRSLGARSHVAGVACRPGHPMLLAEHAGRFVVGLPGNPYAAFVAAHTILAPLLHALNGGALGVLPRFPLRNASGLRRSAEARIVPVRWTSDGLAVEPCPGHGAAFLRGAAVADALAVLTPDDYDIPRLVLL